MVAPAVVAHCDWSREARKRWMAVAVRQGGDWHIGLSEPVGDTASLTSRLKGRAQQPGPVLIGFDFPIGLPQAYGERTGFNDFRDALTAFGEGGLGRLVSGL